MQVLRKQAIDDLLSTLKEFKSAKEEFKPSLEFFTWFRCSDGKGKFFEAINRDDNALIIRDERF
jgi:hypothetical protein